MSKKKLIIGADGFVGRALTQKLSARREQLFLTSRKKKFTYPGAKVYLGDLNDSAFCAKILKGIHTVYYLAGYKKNIAWHLKYPIEFFQGNLYPLLNFLTALKDSKVKQLVYLSSTIVDYIDIQAKKIDGYVLGKAANELAFKFFANQTPGIDIKIIRSAPIYGPGDNFNPVSANFIPAIILRIDQSQKELTVWGRGVRKMQFIYIDDLIDNLIAATKSQKVFFIFGHPEVVTINQVVAIILSLLNKKLTIHHDLSQPDKKSHLNKFNNLIKPKTNIKLGLKKTIDFYQSLIV